MSEQSRSSLLTVSTLVGTAKICNSPISQQYTIPMMSADKKTYCQRYRTHWESEQRFKGWLQPVLGDNTKARCKICGTVMKAHLKSLVGHSDGKKHKRNMIAGSSGHQPLSRTPLRDNKMASSEDDDSWTPPSEAELKVIEAKRERNNKISMLMGQYLLKGYKMLATTCPVCDCVLLEDRNSSKYCIGCCEVDADTKKDNPAVNEEAARKAVEEIQHRQKQDKEESPFRTELFRLQNSSKTTSNKASTASLSVATSTTDTHHTKAKINSESLSIHGVDFSEDVPRVMSVLKEKLVWASSQLQATTSVPEARSLAELISESCKAITALRDL